MTKEQFIALGLTEEQAEKAAAASAAAMKTVKDKYEADAKELRLATAVKLALAGKVHDPDIVAGLLDKTKIELDDNGSVKAGLDDQIKALKTSKAFLFVSEDKGAGQFQFRGTNPADRGGAGGSSGGGGDRAADFGKRVADFAKAGHASMEAQKAYFGG